MNDRSRPQAAPESPTTATETIIPQRCRVKGCAARGRCPWHDRPGADRRHRLEWQMRLRPGDAARGHGRQVYVNGQWVTEAQARTLLAEDGAR